MRSAMQVTTAVEKEGIISIVLRKMRFLALILVFAHACKKQEIPLFKLLPPEKTGLEFSNDLLEDDSFNIIQYLYYYNGGGVATGDINNDGWTDIYFASNRESNRLFLNLGKDESGSIKFRDITEESGVAGSGSWSTGVVMADLNGDGWLDIYQCQVGGYKAFQGRNQLFINNGCAGQTANNEGVSCLVTFTDRAEAYDIDHSGFSTHSAVLDYDLDGDLDLYLLCHSVHSTESYRDTAATRKRDNLAGDRLYKNLLVENRGKAMAFEEVSDEAGILGGIAGYGLGVAVGDIDQNGYPDIYVGNDFHENDFLYMNQGDGTFLEQSTTVFGHTSYFTMGADLADVNNDGFSDLVTLDMKPDDEFLFKSAQGPDPYEIYRFKRSFGYHDQFPRNMLQLNRGLWQSGSGWFSEVGQMSGMAATDWSWSALLVDFDLDGWKDLHVTNGIVRRPNDLDYLRFISNRQIQEEATDLELADRMPSGKVSNVVFRNQLGASFQDVTQKWQMNIASLSNGAASADFDQDGDLDLVINNINQTAFYYENQRDKLSQMNFVKIKLIGTKYNQQAIGAIVQIYHDSTMQSQEVYPSRGWQSSSDVVVHFGLGNTTQIDSLKVRWPDRQITILHNPPSGQLHIIDRNDVSVKPVIQEHIDKKFTISALEDVVHGKHTENTFYDSNREPLIPYFLSTQGPRITGADVNGDGLIDIYLGGATGQAGQLFLQSSDHFKAAPTSVFEKDQDREDTGVAFFDADGDGDQDLYVGSGGNQFYHQDSLLLDRLYLNDGAGDFSKASDHVPPVFGQTSVVSPADFDEDGDIDLFVGNRGKAVNYGARTNSYLLLNDGSGLFSVSASTSIDLASLGMVTDATWSDIENDGDLDLIVIGDWLAPTLFKQEEGKFIKSLLPIMGSVPNNPVGWWSAIAIEDLDNDGDDDLVLGNFGLNSNLQPTVEEPVSLYLADFDANLTADPILTYFRQGKEYTLEGLDALSSQLVYLKKDHRVYREFASKPVGELFSAHQLETAVVSQVTEFRSMIALNDGKGNFTLHSLPWQAQISPVFAIEILDANKDDDPDLLLGGNLYEVQPAIGRMDASIGTLLLGDGNGSFSPVSNEEYGLNISGQVRDFLSLPFQGERITLVARNNEKVQVLKIDSR